MNYKIKDNYITCSKCGSKVFTAYTEVLSDIEIEIVNGRPRIYFDFVDVKEKSDVVDIQCGNCGENISSSYNKIVNDFFWINMSEQEFLESVRNANITPKMYEVINAQTARYFEKSNEYVIDFELYRRIEKYKSFTLFEKAVIAYRANERLSGDGFYTDGFLSYWYTKTIYGASND